MPDHFYTTDVAEVSRSIAQHGYHLEGIACYVYHTQYTGTVALMRAFNPATGDHFYTIDQGEYERAITKNGYKAEGPACYIYRVHHTGTLPLLRLYNAATGDHFYTTDQDEYERAITYGYKAEDTACHVHDLATAPGASTALYRLWNGS